MLTFEFFSLTSLVSLEIFHGVWTIAFFCLTIIDTKTVLPNASCLLAGYLPATTVLHILLIPNDYPLPYIITDAVTTLLAIVTMFLLLRMECSQILQEAEELWQQQPPSPGSDAGTNSTTSPAVPAVLRFRDMSYLLWWRRWLVHSIRSGIQVWTRGSEERSTTTTWDTKRQLTWNLSISSIS